MDIKSEELNEFLQSVLATYGYDFTGYAEASMRRRISRFIAISNTRTLTNLHKQILEDDKLFENFVQEISVTVTEMFRDPAFYRCLRENVMKRLATYPFIKIWVAGCATGEEVYSLAILLKEEGLLSRSVIYATDINQRSLKIAREGIYPVENMKLHTANYQKSGGSEAFSEYYKAKYNMVMFDKSLKQNIVFAPHNLAVDKSFNEFQLIVCRNVLIYFTHDLQNKVINLFYESLCTFGMLGLGNKETLAFSTSKNFFTDIDRKEKIFMKVK